MSRAVRILIMTHVTKLPDKASDCFPDAAIVSKTVGLMHLSSQFQQVLANALQQSGQQIFA